MLRVEAAGRCSVWVALSVAVLLAMPGPGWAVEPGPGDDRLSLEARVTPPIVEAPDTDVSLCVQNVNRRTSGGQALVPGDTWTFRLEAGGGTFAPLAGCPADITMNSVTVIATDFACAVAPDAVVLTYVGAPKTLAYEESFCIGETVELEVDHDEVGIIDRLQDLISTNTRAFAVGRIAVESLLPSSEVRN